MAVSSPFEHLELQHGESATFRVERYEVGETKIYPAHQPGGKVIKVIRLHVPKADKETFPHWWDVTATKLVAQIEEHLRRPDLARLRFTVTAWGVPPKKHFTLDVNPVA